VSTRQVSIAQEDFSGGAQRDIAPHLIDLQAGWDFLNLVLDDDGSAYRRGGSVPFSVNGMDGPGRFIFDGILNVGRRTIVADASKTYVVGSDDETIAQSDSVGMLYPKQTAVMKGLLFGGGGWISGGARSNTTHTASSVVTTTFGSRTVTRSGGSWSGSVVPGHLMKIGTARVYEVASVESATSLTLREPYKGTSLTGQTAVFYPTYRHVSGDPYSGAEYVVVCQNRLVYGSGRIVAFSDIDDPHTLPSVNYHELPTGATICGLAELGGDVIVFTTDGVWVISGLEYEIVDPNGNGQHTVRRLSEGIKLAGIAGVAGYDNRLVVPDSDGIWLMDGVSSPQRISRGIERPYQAWLQRGYRVGRAVVFKGHYILPIVSPLGTVRDTFVCRIDRPVRSRYKEPTWSWVRFSGDGGEIPAFTVRHGESELAPRLLGVQGRAGGKIVDCSDFFNPQSLNSTDSDGTSPVAQLTTRDFETGNLTVNAVRALRLRYELAGGTARVEHGPGGVNYDEAGYANPLRKWGDPDAEWGDPDGVWGVGFGPADPDVVVPPGSVPAFVQVGTLEESDGITPEKIRINSRVRYSRLRITCSAEVEMFRVRALELFIRPSRAVRR
jgi:hypothetical protein